MIAALDVGSTNSRAWLIESDAPGGAATPRVHARATAAIGVRDAVFAGSAAPVRDVVRRLVGELARTATPDAVVGAGMITSPHGIREVPHVPAPAGVDDLARRAVTFTDPDLCAAPITLIPGVRTDGAAALETDVMRGEETLVAGLLGTGLAAPGSGVLNAGSHWKYIRIDAQRRIGPSRTSLGGEVLRAAATATLLKSAVPDGTPVRADEAWLARGADAAKREGLLRAMFGVRLMQLRNDSTAADREDFLVGALIGDDIEALLQSGALDPREALLVTGSEPAASAWVALLGRAGVAARALTAQQVESSFLTGLATIIAARPSGAA